MKTRIQTSLINKYLHSKHLLFLVFGSLIVLISISLLFVVYGKSGTREDTKTLLGRALFFDKTLSANGQVSCSTCHNPERAFTDGRATSKGLGQGSRNAPSLEEVGRLQRFMWDGRHVRLADQVLEPFTNPREHGLTSLDDLVTRVNASRQLNPLITKACRGSADVHCVRAALVAYVGSLSSPVTKFDQFFETGDTTMLSPSEIRGWTLFTGSAGCSSCHAVQGSKPLLTDEAFHTSGLRLTALRAKLEIPSENRIAGILSNPEISALGRFNVTGKLADIGKFRTPSLRGVKRTAPYMHDGSIATLEAALEYELYYRPMNGNKTVSLTPLEKTDLLNLLKAF